MTTHVEPALSHLELVEARASFLAGVRAAGATPQSLKAHDQALTRFAEYLHPRTLVAATSGDVGTFLAYLGELGVSEGSRAAYRTVLARWLEHAATLSVPGVAEPECVPSPLLEAEVASCFVPTPEPAAAVVEAVGWTAEPPAGEELAEVEVVMTPAPAQAEATPGFGGFEKVDMSSSAFAFPDESSPDLPAPAVAVAAAPVPEAPARETMDENATLILPAVGAWSAAAQAPSAPPALPETEASEAPSWLAPPPMARAGASAIPADRGPRELEPQPPAGAPGSGAEARAGDGDSWMSAGDDDGHRAVAGGGEDTPEMVETLASSHHVDGGAAARDADARKDEGETWSAQVRGSVVPDLTLVAVKNMAKRGDLGRHDLIRKAGGQWQRAGEFAPLVGVFDVAQASRAPVAHPSAVSPAGSILAFVAGVAGASVLSWLAALSWSAQVPAAWIASGVVVGVALRRMGRPGGFSVGLAATGALCVPLAAQWLIFETIQAGVAEHLGSEEARTYGAHLVEAMTPTAWGLTVAGVLLAVLVARRRG